MAGRRENDSRECQEATIGAICRHYAAALLSGDEVAAEVAIREAIDAKLTTAQIDDEIIAPALWLVGDLWQRGEISVADEHHATEISLRVLALQREAIRTARARGAHRVMLATPAAELHTVALQMSGNLLREAGYETVMLGANVPPESLAKSASRHDTDVICMSATMPGGGDQITIAVHEVQQECPDARFVIGGRGITSRLRAMPGIEVCDRVPEVVEAVDAVAKRADSN
jgi:MerR family transcriptional regulator, light-induced transcriptional regulator